MKSYGARPLQITDTINLALNVGSEKIDRDQSKLIKSTNYCHKDDCKV